MRSASCCRASIGGAVAQQAAVNALRWLRVLLSHGAAAHGGSSRLLLPPLLGPLLDVLCPDG